MAASAGNAVGAIGGFKKIKEGKAMQRAGQQGIDNFEWEDLKNPFEELQVSTAGAEMRADEAARVSATVVNAGRAGGTRGIAATAGRAQAQNNLVNRDIAANLDEQQKAIDMAVAKDDVQTRAMVESRQANELAGYGQMMNVGMDMKYQGFGDIQASGQAQSEHNMELFETFGGGMMGGGGGMSDRRLKKNIRGIGFSPKGYKIYSFEYTDTKYGIGVFQGVMADEVPEEARIETEDGFFMVDYSKLDVEFKKIK